MSPAKNILLLDSDDIRLALKDYVRRFDTQTDAAKVLGVSRSHLSKMLGGEKSVFDNVAKKLGYMRVVYYMKRA